LEWEKRELLMAPVKLLFATRTTTIVESSPSEEAEEAGEAVAMMFGGRGNGVGDET
jgi:hypothetical protein